jgi:divalent metal cation (Fe/Co/Zn/Cd) transporter
MKRKPDFLRWGLILEYLTLGWNLIGTVIVISSGLQANSIALVGFAMDSLIEIGASTVVVWRLTNAGNKKREQTSQRLLGTSFFVLATYILVQSVSQLVAQIHPKSSLVGTIWLAVTFVVMLALAAGKSYTGRKIDNLVLLTEARVTLIDAYLAGSVLLGLLLNMLLGWWWADAVAGLAIVFYGFKEGWHAWVESSSH